MPREGLALRVRAAAARKADDNPNGLALIGKVLRMKVFDLHCENQPKPTTRTS